MSDPMPASPWGDDPLDEVLVAGRAVLAALMDRTVQDGLFGLYEATLSLGRDDLEAGVLVQALDLLSGAEQVRERCGTEVAERDWSEGERLLGEVVRPVLRGGLDAIRGEVIALSNRQLRAVLRDVREAAYVGYLREREVDDR